MGRSTGARIAIIVEGGVVQNVLVDDPSVVVFLRDWDEEDDEDRDCQYVCEVNVTDIDEIEAGISERQRELASGEPGESSEDESSEG